MKDAKAIGEIIIQRINISTALFVIIGAILLPHLDLSIATIVGMLIFLLIIQDILLRDAMDLNKKLITMLKDADVIFDTILENRKTKKTK